MSIEARHGRFWPSYKKSVEVQPEAVTPHEIQLSRPKALDFAARGWYLADFDLALRFQPGERSLWLGEPPDWSDFILAARAEDVRSWACRGCRRPVNELRGAFANARRPICCCCQSSTARATSLTAAAWGLGVENCRGLARECAASERPLRETFEEIRARGGLAVYDRLGGTQQAGLRKDIFSLFPRLKESQAYSPSASTIRLYGASELPFDTVVGPAYDLLAFDGTDAAERVWFNLLNNGYQMYALGAGGGSLEGGRLPFGQTFVHVEGQLSSQAVIEALRNGRATISFGPAVFCRILERDMGPGAVLPADDRPLVLTAEFHPSNVKGAHISAIEILRNGVVIQAEKMNEGETVMRWPFSEKTSAWYMVRVTEERARPPRHAGLDQPYFLQKCRSPVARSGAKPHYRRVIQRRRAGGGNSHRVGARAGAAADRYR